MFSETTSKHFLKYHNHMQMQVLQKHMSKIVQNLLKSWLRKVDWIKKLLNKTEPTKIETQNL